MRQEIALNQNAYTVGLDVLGQMIAAHETFVTNGTSESFSPVWVRKCRWSSSERVNLSEHLTLSYKYCQNYYLCSAKLLIMM